MGYWQSAVLFGSIIAVIFLAHRVLRLNAILSFWLAYILTRPLGASLGDYFSQPRDAGGLNLGTSLTSAIFLAAILATVIYLTLTKRDRIERSEPRRAQPSAGAHVLIVANKTASTPGLLEAVRQRASRGPARFSLLVPNPDDHLVFDRNSKDIRAGEQVLALAVPLLAQAAGSEIQARVARSPNAYDDIVEEINNSAYDEIILSTLPSHVSHWLHVDLPSRIAGLGVPLTTVTPSAGA